MKKVIVFLMMLTIAISPLFRGLFFSFETSAFLAILALFSFFYFMIKLSNKEPMHFNKWFLVFGLMLVTAYALAFLKAIYLRDHIQMIMQYIEYFIVSFILYDYYYDKKNQFCFTLMLTVTLSGFINAVIGIEALSHISIALSETLNSGGKRVGGTLQYANSVALLFGVCIVFALTLINASKKSFFRILLTAIGNVLFLAMWLTGSRGGLIVAAAALFLLFIIQPNGHRLKSLGTFMCMVLPAFYFLQRISSLTGLKDIVSISKWIIISLVSSAILAILYELIILATSRVKIESKASSALRIIMTLTFLVALLILIIFFKDQLLSLIPRNIIQRFQRIGLDDINIYYRLQYDKDALKLISENWLFGYGGKAFSSLLYGVQDFFYVCTDVHNHYLQIFSEAGVIAFLGFSVLVISSLIRLIKGCIKEKEFVSKTYSAGLLIAFLALAIHSSFDFNLTFVSLALLFWALMVGAAIYSPANTENKQGNKSIIISKPLVDIILVVFTSALLSLNGLYTASGYNEYIAVKYLSVKNYKVSQIHFEEASRLDSLHSAYHMQLARIYNYYGDTSLNSDLAVKWRNKAFDSIKKSVMLNPYYPTNIEILALTYFKANLPLDALENVQRLIKIQPLENKNYELLARGYIASAQYYIQNDQIDKAKELLLLCTQIDTLPNVVPNNTLSAYKEEALSLLEKIK